MPRRDKQTHIERQRKASDGLPDRAVADQPHGLARKLRQRRAQAAEVGAVRPVAAVHQRVILPDLLRQLQQQRQRHLRDRAGGIAHDVADGNAARPGGVKVDDVIARGQQPDQLQTRRGLHGRRVERHLVREDHLRIGDARGQQLRRRPVIDRQVAEPLQLLPAQIAGVRGVAVENDDFLFHATQNSRAALR